MENVENRFTLTNDQFEKLSRFIDAAAAVVVSRALQQNSALRGVDERGYESDKEAARSALVGDA